MARTKRTTEVIDHAAEATGMAIATNPQMEAARNERVEALVVQFGEGLPWHLAHYESEIRAAFRGGCALLIRAGSLLVVAKEAATHGEWAGILSRLGLEPSQASRMMEAARRINSLPNRATSQDFLEAAGTQSKLFELLSLPEKQFAELAETGETGELALDDVAKMTVRELRMALREAREDIRTKADRAAKREDEIAKLESNLRKARQFIKTATPTERAKKLLLEIEASVIGVETHLKAVYAGLQLLVDEEAGMEFEGALARIGMGIVTPAAEALAFLSSIGVKGPAQAICVGLEGSV